MTVCPFPSCQRRPAQGYTGQPCGWCRRCHAADQPRGDETIVRQVFNIDRAWVVVRERCWGSDMAAHIYSLDRTMRMYTRIRHTDQVKAMLRVDLR